MHPLQLYTNANSILQTIVCVRKTFSKIGKKYLATNSIYILDHLPYRLFIVRNVC